LREVYRHKKHQLYNRLEEQNKFLAIGIIFTGTQMVDYWEMETVFNKVFNKLLVAIDEQKI
jgi:hypothetical protein